MRFNGVIRAAALALCTLPVAAQASTVVSNACSSVASPAGCLFSGNINSNPNVLNTNSYKNAELNYNLFNNWHPGARPDITLNYLADTDSASGLITGAGTAAGTWSMPGFLVDFIAVKAANYFVLYQISPASSGNWDTFDIPYHRNPRDLSHIVFFGQANAVPEPAAWGMMIGGFGLAGAALRRQKARKRTRFA